MKIKKAACVFLSLLLCLSAALCVPAYAQVAASVPEIGVHGFMASTIYENPGTQQQKQIFPPETGVIVKAVAKSVPNLASALVSRSWDALLDTINPSFNEVVGAAYCDGNGDVKPNTGVDWEYPDEVTVRESKKTSFVYDWRLSPMEAAEQLHAYIEYVKECTGSNKVSLRCHSFGNCVGLSYVALYGTDSLAGFVCDASAFLGESYNGELMTGRIAISADALCNYLLDNVLAGTEFEQAGYVLIETLNVLLVTDAVEAAAGYVLDKAVDRAAKEVLLQMFGKWPSIWAMVPDEYYEEARSYVFDTMLVDEDCTGLLEKLDEYDEIVRYNREDILNEVSGINFGVIARYNKAKIPITDNPNALTDNNIDVRYSSLGAVTAEYGSVLPDDYTQARYAETDYISPDRMIDASSCMFPERTWFVRDMGHSGSCSGLDELCEKILTTEGFTVNSDEHYPQFMVYDAATDTISGFTEYVQQEPGFMETVFGFLQKIKSVFFGLVSM